MVRKYVLHGNILFSCRFCWHANNKYYSLKKLRIWHIIGNADLCIIDKGQIMAMARTTMPVINYYDIIDLMDISY